MEARREWNESAQVRQLRKRIVLADTEAVLRSGLKLLLRQLGQEVIGEASDGIEAVHMCRRLNPDLMIMDIELDSIDGIRTIERVRRRREAMPIIVLSGIVSERHAADALRAGAQAFILKRSGAAELSAALRAVRRGERYLDPAMQTREVSDASCGGDLPMPAGAARLTGRERQILTAIAEGKRNKQIAVDLGISVKTVEAHRGNLMRKLDVHNAAEIAYWARRLGAVHE